MLKRLGLFLGGSALGAVIDYAVTLGAVRLLGADPTLALGLAMILSASAVFAWHDRITFPGARGSRLTRYVRFMAWSALVFALRALLLALFLRAGLPLAVALALAIGVATVVNFAVSRALIFARPIP